MVLVHVYRFPNKQNHPHAIYPHETVGAVPVCPPERPRSGVSIPKIHALCAGNERWMRPCRATRAGTQAPPLPISVIHLRAIPHKQNNHLHAIHPNDINHPHAICPNEINCSTRNLPKRRQPPTRNLPKRNRRGGACVPARTSAQRRFHAKNTRIVRGGMNDGCAPAGRRGRAHRHRPYSSPPYFSTQSHTNKIPSMRNSPQTKSTIHTSSTKRNQSPTRNLPKRNRRGGACVPARTSA